MEPFLGQIILFAGNFAPRGWALCDGQLLAINQNSALFSILGTMYGGDGRTTFGLPDLRGRLPIHVGQGPGLTPVSQGQKGGSEHVTLTIPNLPPHSHDVEIAVNNGNGDAASPDKLNISSITNGFSEDKTNGAFLGGVVNPNPVGEGKSIDIRNPHLGLNYIIALQGLFPSRS
ncbi:hypothetical protein WH52_02525 [Tenacibaculum holothuriorum]|uniref:Phage tail collar domain-containing protein n=1 Tax=Tenacibaculum holothuriorum TaxID=1635173 RepID=A0A1Y2PIA0_9FLAO|nr:tail fiber protein [Tenacibaculum holothuriorum]OSY89527.1 hypothetical protein WH52_02525 [Tenacibaculum holothuriorum]